jgi:hypothetical protein
VRIIEFAEMLQGSIDEKKIKNVKTVYMKVTIPNTMSLEVEIEALEWMQGQIQHLVINNE